MSARLIDIEGGDHIKAAEAMYSSRNASPGLKETPSFWRDERRMAT